MTQDDSFSMDPLHDEIFGWLNNQFKDEKDILKMLRSLQEGKATTSSLNGPNKASLISVLLAMTDVAKKANADCRSLTRKLELLQVQQVPQALPEPKENTESEQESGAALLGKVADKSPGDDPAKWKTQGRSNRIQKSKKDGVPVCKAYFKPNFGGAACGCDRAHPTVCQSCSEKRDHKCRLWHVAPKPNSGPVAENRPRGKVTSSSNPKDKSNHVNHSNLRLKFEVSEKLRYKAELQASQLRASQKGRISYSQVTARPKGAQSLPTLTPDASALPGGEAMPEARFLNALEKMAESITINLEEKMSQQFAVLSQALQASQS